jgi:hypothetical protein
VILDVLRFWGLSMMRARDPEFYEWLGSPELIAGHWGYFPSGWLQRAVADPAFGELTTSVRFAMRAAYLFNLIASALFGVILFMMAMMVIVRLLM